MKNINIDKIVDATSKSEEVFRKVVKQEFAEAMGKTSISDILVKCKTIVCVVLICITAIICVSIYKKDNKISTHKLNDHHILIIDHSSGSISTYGRQIREYNLQHIVGRKK